MENLFMSAGIITGIIFCIVGILKLPFDGFKKSHCKTYKAVFTIISFVLSIGLSVLNEKFILCGELISIDFVILISVVIAGVFCGYGGVYEGLGFKELVKRIIENVKKAKDIAKDKKTVDFLNKIDNVDEAIKILEERKKGNINKVDEV